jgi:hypothetical protein
MGRRDRGECGCSGGGAERGAGGAKVVGSGENVEGGSSSSESIEEGGGKT